jgi:HSP20 family protein
MTLTAYNPFDFQIDRLLEDTLRPVARKSAAWTPPCSAWEDPDRFTLELALPGWESKDVKITAEDGVLTVEGSRQAEAPEKQRAYFVREMAWNQFARSFTLPSYVNEGMAKASFKYGVLSIEFPKREETKPRQIAIEG